MTQSGPPCKRMSNPDVFVNDRQSKHELLRFMQRRSFVSALMVSLAASAVPVFALSGDLHIDVGQLADPELSKLRVGSGGIIKLGRTYRHQVPKENSIQVLTERLLSGKLSLFPADLNALLAEQVREDFTCGDTVQLMGWILSRTEARQCAIYSLLDS